MSQQDTLRDLKKIAKVLVLANATAIEKELFKIVTSEDRKKMWILLDGKRMPKDIAKDVGVTQMAVSYFLNAGVAAELIEYDRGQPPHKILDYVPPAWLSLVKIPTEEESSQATQLTFNPSETE